MKALLTAIALMATAAFAQMTDVKLGQYAITFRPQGACNNTLGDSIVISSPDGGNRIKIGDWATMKKGNGTYVDESTRGVRLSPFAKWSNGRMEPASEWVFEQPDKCPFYVRIGFKGAADDVKSGSTKNGTKNGTSKADVSEGAPQFMLASTSAMAVLSAVVLTMF